MPEKILPTTFTLTEARAELARQECLAHGHDYEHVEVTPILVGDPPTVRRQLTRAFCARCGEVWRVVQPEEVAGYLVVGREANGTPWNSPKMSATKKLAEEVRDFWVDAQPKRFGPLRIAKVVLIEEEPTAPVAVEEDQAAAATADPPA